MDDLNDDPHKVAEDIIREALQGDKSEKEATERLVHILTSYHQLQNDIAESKEQKATENDIVVDGFLAWKTKDNHQKEGPYCARCYIKDKEIFNSSTWKRDYRSVPNAEKDVVIRHLKGNILNVLIMITIDWVHVNNQNPKNIQ